MKTLVGTSYNPKERLRLGVYTPVAWHVCFLILSRDPSIPLLHSFSNLNPLLLLPDILTQHKKDEGPKDHAIP